MADILYRNLVETDIEQLHALASDWEVVRQMGSWPWPADREFTANRCKPYAGRGFVWGIFAPTLIGTVSVTEGELGYMLAPSHWGQGIMSKMTVIAINHGFRDPSLLEITASVWADNPGSRRVLSKLGFAMSRNGIEHALARDEETALEYYSLQRDVWQRLRSGAQ